MTDMMTFPDTVEEFMEQYKVVDTERVYTNGTELVPIFRMKQWFEHLPSAEPEIIRCKDCKHYKVYNLCKDWKGNTKRCTLSAVATRTSDDFCSKAERRTDKAI